MIVAELYELKKKSKGVSKYFCPVYNVPYMYVQTRLQAIWSSY